MPASSASMFDQLLGGLGRVLEQTGYGAHGKAGAGEAVTQAQRAAAAWVVGRTLRPRHINWPRLLLATAAGVALGEVLERFGTKRNGRHLPAGRSRVVPGSVYDAGPRSARASRAEEEARAAEDALADEEALADDNALGEGQPLSAEDVYAAEGAYADDELFMGEEAYTGGYAEGEVHAEIHAGPRSRRRREELQEEGDDRAAEVRRFLERAGGDLAVAAAYASVAYPRIPGPPLFRAAVFGAVDAAVSGSGGVANLITGISPRLRVPMRQLLLDEERRMERALALALALGLIYRDDPYDD